MAKYWLNNDPLLKGKQITFKDAGETCAPSPPKQANEQQNNAVRESYDEDQYFKFIYDIFEKSVLDGLEYMFQNQANLQERVMRHKKQF